VFYYLIKTPQAYGKLLAEIDKADRGKCLSTSVTFEESQKLPYLYVELDYLYRHDLLT